MTVVGALSPASGDRFTGPGYRRAQLPLTASEHFAISDSGEYVASAGGGALYVAPLHSGSDVDDREEDQIPLSGRGHAEALTFVADGPELVSASGDVLSLWDIERPAQLSAARLEVPSSPNAGGFPVTAVSPDGSQVAVTSDSGLDFNSPSCRSGRPSTTSAVASRRPSRSATSTRTSFPYGVRTAARYSSSATAEPPMSAPTVRFAPAGARRARRESSPANRHPTARNWYWSTRTAGSRFVTRRTATYSVRPGA